MKVLTDTLLTQATAFADARSQWKQQFLLFRHHVPTLSPELFWHKVVLFRDILLDRMLHPRGSNSSASEAAADEFMRLTVVNGGDLGEAVHFACSWRRYANMAHAAGDRAPFGFDRGDDGYGDLMDALPLLGQKIHNKLVGGGFNSLAEFNDAVDVACDTAGRVLNDVVLGGENYFGSHLSDAAQKWVVLEARRYGQDGG
jgi:hypothetical protein